MRVILTIDYSPWSSYSGGAQRSTHGLATALSRRGHDVTVIFTKPPWEKVNVPDRLPYRLQWAVLPALKSRRDAFLRPLGAFFVAYAVRRLLDRNTPTVVHSNGEEGGMVHLLRRRHRFGFVATPRHPRYPTFLLEDDRLRGMRWLRAALRDGKYLMQGSAVRHADVVCPPSAWAATLAQRAFKVESERLRPVPNGVPEEFLGCAWESRPEGPLVFFGRFDTTKGVDTLVEALGRLGDAAPPSLLIGRGPERVRIERRIIELGLAQKVQVCGWMTHDELGTELVRSSMVVLPSREENFSLAVLSAMAVGPPVISTRVGGTPEIIRDGETGVLVPPDDPGSLAEAILSLRSDESRARALGRAGRRHVRKHLTWDVAATKFEKIYLSLRPVFP